MSTEILTLTQLLSPSFPVGAFAYSHGLETAIETGLITNADDLIGWLRDLLTHGSGRTDAVLLNVAFRNTDPIVDASARAFAASKERLQETDLQGMAFCATVNAVWQYELENLTYPVAVGQTAKRLGLDPDLTTAMYLQAFVSNLAAVAMRLVPLGQTDGQKVQLALKPLCIQIAQDTQTATLDDLHGCTFMSDIVSMRHETQYSRIFRS
jgi:urease accessory protein